MSTGVRQAGCVLIGERAVLIEGPPGSGKSSLALALIDRGAKLVGDDGVSLGSNAGALWASPPPNTAGLIEIRNLGLARMATAEGPVALLLRLDPEAPRFVEEAAIESINGHQVPVIALFPLADGLALRAEWALKMYGRKI